MSAPRMAPLADRLRDGDEHLVALFHAVEVVDHVELAQVDGDHREIGVRLRGERGADGAREALFVEEARQRVVLVQEIGVVVVLLRDAGDLGRCRFAPVDELERGDERRRCIDVQVHRPRRDFEELPVPELLLASLLVRVAGLIADAVAASVVRAPDRMAGLAVLAGALRDVELAALVRVDDARELVFFPIGIEQVGRLLQCQIHSLHDDHPIPSRFAIPDTHSISILL